MAALVPKLKNKPVMQNMKDVEEKNQMEEKT